jgi:hypothetical protein
LIYNILYRKIFLKAVFITLACLFFILPLNVFSQAGACDKTTFIEVNLSNNPDSIWTLANVGRDLKNCCGRPNNEPCVKFKLTLHPKADGIVFSVPAGAVPAILEYQIMDAANTECELPAKPANELVCLDGTGPFYLVFCKPGNNNNTYKIESKQNTAVSGAITVSEGCRDTITTVGFNPASLIWNSVLDADGGTTKGQWNHYLTDLDGNQTNTGVDTVVVSASPGYPEWIDFEVKGLPKVGCLADTAYDTVRVFFVSTLDVMIDPQDPAICFNGTGVGLTAIGNGGAPPYSYLWSTGATTATIIANAIGDYSVTVSDTTNCGFVTDLVNVIKFDSEITADAGANQVRCANNPTASLNGIVNEADGGEWSGGAGVFDDRFSLNTFYTPTAGEISSGEVVLTLTTTGNRGCPASTDNVTITFNPVATVNSGGNGIVCAGSSYQLNGSFGGGASSVTWSSPTCPDGTCFDNVNLPNAIYTPNATDISNGSVILTISTNNPAGPCNAVSSTMTLSVLAAPTASIIPDPALVCVGSVLSLDVNLAGGSLPYLTHSWGGEIASLSATNIPNPTFTNATPGDYALSYSVTDNNGCVGTDIITITNAELPTVSAGNDVAICNGNSTPIGGSPTADLGGGGYSYLWNNAASLSADNVANPTASPVANTTYSVTVTDANTCQNTSSIIVTVNNPPTANAGNDTDICLGDNIQIGGSPTADLGAGGYTYLWDNAASLSASNVANPTASPIMNTTYSVTVTDAIGCIDVAQIVITVNNLPVVDAGNDDEICLGDDIILGGAPTASDGSGMGYVYTWDNGAAATENPTVSPVVNTLFSLTVTDSNGCVGTDDMFVTVHDLPIADAGNNDAICLGESITITASGGTAYLWSTGATSAAISVNPVVNTSYFVTVTDANNCVNTDNVSINVNALPNAHAGNDDEICSGQSISIGDSPAASGGSGIGYVYAWNNAASLSADNVLILLLHL